VALRLDLWGRSEQPNATLTIGDFDYAGFDAVPFAFAAAEVLVDDAPLTGVESFRIKVANDLAAGPSRAGAAAFLLAGQRSASLELTRADADGALKAALRDGAQVSFAATFAHPLGHTLSVGLPRLRAASTEDDARPGAIALTTARLEAAAEAEGEDITYLLDLSD